MGDNARFVRAITILHRAFGKEMDDFSIEAYRIGCGDLPLDELEAAVTHAIRSLKWMPAPAELSGRVSLRKPGLTKCAACGLKLELSTSITNGYCGRCWVGIEHAEDEARKRELNAPARRLLDG